MNVPSNNWLDTIDLKKSASSQLNKTDSFDISQLSFEQKKEYRQRCGMNGNYLRHLNGGGAKRNKLKW